MRVPPCARACQPLRSPPSELGGLVCAGTFVWGVAGSNDCPANSMRIVDDAACQRAAFAIQPPSRELYTFRESQTREVFPSGCYCYAARCDSCEVAFYIDFNNHPVGNGEPNSRLLCVIANTAVPTQRGFTYKPTGAPTRAARSVPRRRRLRAGLAGALIRGCAGAKHAVTPKPR